MSSSPSAATRTVAAFDFDGTLATGDAVIPFFAELRGHHRVARSLLALLPIVPRRDRDLLKERFIAHLVAGHPAGEVRAVGERFAAALLEKRMRPTMIERVRWHQEQGHETVIVSASLDVYLRPLAAQLDFDEVLCTTLEIVDDRATGRLIGANVRKAEKVRMLQQHLGADHRDVELYAYGNSSGDHDMLASAHHAYWLDRKGRMTAWQSGS